MKYLKKIIASINIKDVKIYIQKLIQHINQESDNILLSEYLQSLFEHKLQVIKQMLNDTIDEQVPEKAIEYINIAIQELKEEYNIIEINYWRERGSKNVIKILRRI